MAESEPLSFFVKLDGPSGPMCGVKHCQWQSSVSPKKLLQNKSEHSIHLSLPGNRFVWPRDAIVAVKSVVHRWSVTAVIRLMIIPDRAFIQEETQSRSLAIDLLSILVRLGWEIHLALSTNTLRNLEKYVLPILVNVLRGVLAFIQEETALGIIYVMNTHINMS